MSDVRVDFFGGVTQPEAAPAATVAPATSPAADPFDIYTPEQFTTPATGTTGTVPSTNTTEFTRNGRLIRRVTFADGTFEETDLGPSGGEGPAQFVPRQDARLTIRAALATFGLESLADTVYDEYAAERVNISNPAAILFSIRETPQYKQRFAANARRAAKGLPELDVSTYIGLEEQYRDLMRANGLPPGFYDQTSDFEKLIEGDVSAVELQSRITEGYRRVADADPEVKRQMRELYNVDEAGLAAYFLDPDRATPVLQRQASAARIAARAQEQGRMGLTVESAEELVARGITPEQAAETFQQVGQLAGLYEEMAGETALTQQQKLGAAFGYDVAAREELQRRQRQRVGEFAGGGQFARTSGATSGTVETGAGTAQ
jgi:hypothetical protein